MRQAPSLQRRHFVLIADVLKLSAAPPDVVRAFCARLRSTNSQFDAVKFIEAATAVRQTAQQLHSSRCVERARA